MFFLLNLPSVFLPAPALFQSIVFFAGTPAARI
jgi:hypothetical protein